jgi:hypothetical protein
MTWRASAGKTFEIKIFLGILDPHDFSLDPPKMVAILALAFEEC